MNLLQVDKEQMAQILQGARDTTSHLSFWDMNNPVSGELKEIWTKRFNKLFALFDNFLNNEYVVVVIGRLNSGKSSLINALLGIHILPEAMKDMTSLITKICYGDQSTAFAVYRSGETEPIEFKREAIEEYVNCRKSRFSKDIEYICVTVNSDLLKEGICFYDCPGLESMNDLNNMLSYEVLARSNAVIMAFSGQDGGGQANYKLIENLLDTKFQQNFKIIFALTKRDTLNKVQYQETRESLDEMIQKARAKLGEENCVDSYNICPVSAYYALLHSQYLRNEVSEPDLYNAIPGLKDKAGIRKLWEESEFEAFRKILKNSILSSSNNQRQMNSLLTSANNHFTALLGDYQDVLDTIDERFGLMDVKQSCEEKEQLIAQLHARARVELAAFDKELCKIEQCSMKEVTQILLTAYNESSRFIDETPIEILKPKRFKLLNDKLIAIIEQERNQCLTRIEADSKQRLKEMLDRLSAFEQDQRNQIERRYLSSEQTLRKYGIPFKVSSSFSPLNTAAGFVGGALAGSAGWVGLLSLPVAMPVVGWIAVSSVGIVTSITSLVLSNTQARKKETLKKKANDVITRCQGEIACSIRNLCAEYRKKAVGIREEVVGLLQQEKTKRKTLLENYDILHTQIQQIRTYIDCDMQAVHGILPPIGSALKKYTMTDLS